MKPTYFRGLEIQLVTKPESEYRSARLTAWKQIQNLRLPAGKVYKLNTGPGEALRDKRLVLKEVYFNPCFKLTHLKTKQVLYAESPRQALRFLRDQNEVIKAERAARRAIDESFSNTGFSTLQKIHEKPNGVVNWYIQKMLLKAKSPNDMQYYVGVEIECGFPPAPDYSKFKPLSSKISLAEDESIQNLPSGFVPKEIRLLTTEETYAQDISEVCTVLHSMGAVVNDSCGLHVHLDMRHLLNSGEAPKIVTQFTNLVKSQKYLQQLVKPKRRSGRYCKPTHQTDPFIMRDRYHAVNGAALEKHQTIEIRLHHGTIEETDITNWITLLLRIKNAAPIERVPSTLESFFRRISLEEKLQKYMEGKIQLYPEVPEPETSSSCEGTPVEVEYV